MEHENKTRIPAWLRPSTIRRMDGCLRRRAGTAMKIEAVVFTNARGLLGRTKGADGLIEKIKAGG